MRSFAALVLAYAALLALSLWLLSGDRVTDPAWRYVVALLPVPAGVGIVASGVARYRRMDEVLQHIHLLALCVAFAVTTVVTFTWGFLEGVGLPRLGAFGAFGLLVGSYALGLLWARGRYR
ncbi:hypothetical protein SAMN05216184_11616 [Georgenia satyanarayanai]|uniref:Uncharacterized protein n=1 Tax=Georgenia satyanarayanai TaxID=860221 RepID=A0A2Y9ASN2_9MICO|nr:hypothetical protein [Georgenia satyanarayanai]PYF97232.1 hypothetical protein A8987_11616 [Georgenia satyanarayanai]SSA46318.1 hypothetical protein SAMN05216184_11616 [Georgenia satyanarayanai]